MKKLLSSLLVLLMVVSLTVPALAADKIIKPSVTAKDTPELVTKEVEIDGKKVTAAAEIVDLSGNPLTSGATGVILPEQLFSVSYTDAANGKVGDTVKDEALAKQITENLKAAYKELTDVKSLGELASDLNDAAKKINAGYNASVYYVSDLFSISVSSDVKLTSAGRVSALEIAKSSAAIRMTFKMGSEKEVPTILQRSDATGKWNMVPTSYVTANNDGTFTAVLSAENGSVAFLRVDSTRLVKDEDTSSSFPWWIILIVVAVVAVVVVVIIVCGKKKAPANQTANKKDANKKS